jgi:hypothetical protein
MLNTEFILASTVLGWSFSVRPCLDAEDVRNYFLIASLRSTGTQVTLGKSDSLLQEKVL